MQWLEAQHTEANARLAALGDGDESHTEHSPEAKAVRIINAIVDHMGIQAQKRKDCAIIARTAERI